MLRCGIPPRLGRKTLGIFAFALWNATVTGACGDPSSMENGSDASEQGDGDMATQGDAGKMSGDASQSDGMDDDGGDGSLAGDGDGDVPDSGGAAARTTPETGSICSPTTRHCPRAEESPRSALAAT